MSPDWHIEFLHDPNWPPIWHVLIRRNGGIACWEGVAWSRSGAERKARRAIRAFESSESVVVKGKS